MQHAASLTLAALTLSTRGVNSITILSKYRCCLFPLGFFNVYLFSSISHQWRLYDVYYRAILQTSRLFL